MLHQPCRNSQTALPRFSKNSPIWNPISAILPEIFLICCIAPFSLTDILPKPKVLLVQRNFKMTNESCRRTFLLQSISGLGATWISAQWPSVLAAATHAHQAVKSSAPAKFEFFTAEQAVEIDAITARIIPTDDSSGAREAGAVHFIDKALVTFAQENQNDYKEGLTELQERVHEMFPALAKFSAGTPEQQDAVLHSFDDGPKGGGRRAFRSAGAQNFFETIRYHTIAAFLIDPDSGRGGNQGGVGWQLINRENQHMFQPPFGYYDKDYPGWQKPAKNAEKK